ncbi:DUF1127 domain-containing protein [Pseudomonas citronellolis]|uniref:DUF1127 domain-containing protein n=1 Tax=Pseudomonas citronellolis TaxID=53408 RepID=UPI0023E361B7|nr:DUF1127 domain-containing protein [Pseudomonas citronellolis]MDF3936887.1 DUF1127 domain-containing protein [Pseudomonas citronellolis]
MDRVLSGTGKDSSTVHTFRAFVVHVLGLLRQWRLNAQGRRQLALLGEYELADSGIDRCARERELSKPFWR